MPIPAPDSPVGEAGLACIDLSSPDLHYGASVLRKACLDSGFFYVVKHGVEDMEKVFAQSKKFFSLSTEEKMKVFRDKKNRGYTPFLDETLDPSQQTKGDCKEGFYIGPEMKEEETEVWSPKPFHGPNQWPSEDLLPGWRETMEKYHEQVLRAGRKIIRLLALALNLEMTYFEKPGVMDSPMAYIRLLHYSGEVSIPEKGIYGAGAHSDYGMITLLATDGVPGLQICRDKDASPQVWEDVQPVPGAFVVNLGDMLERWSNGLFRSTLHRVILTGEERYSIAFFLDPNFDCLVECLPACCSLSNPPKYPPITSGHYLIERYKLSYKN
ncbi:hypothetical protein KP509_05G026700 [Ceratopteris richardii]|uniref:Fe2OG dioxygenase domain-containing protein n=5 Tax=Ceratopteris richardii TaxID=49495 RepID=A0A8T2UPQ9_CERRI|nr:hypothetical protein KP509_05G026700 [Ceratopteris richardii]